MPLGGVPKGVSSAGATAGRLAGWDVEGQHKYPPATRQLMNSGVLVEFLAIQPRCHFSVLQGVEESARHDGLALPGPQAAASSPTPASMQAAPTTRPGLSGSRSHQAPATAASSIETSRTGAT